MKDGILETLFSCYNRGKMQPFLARKVTGEWDKNILEESMATASWIPDSMSEAGKNKVKMKLCWDNKQEAVRNLR